MHDARPRIAILVGGIGMSSADTEAAVETLPAAVSLAVSPYAADLSRLISDIRAHGHEVLIAVPMEPEGSPLNDPDNTLALMTSLPEEENLKRLRAVLEKADGAAGATNLAGPIRGERLMQEADMFAGVLREVAGRGMFFLDTADRAATARDRSADIMLDEAPLDGSALDDRLDRLTQIARRRGMAVGAIALPRPIVLERLGTWSRLLNTKGVTLVPVGALFSASPEVRNTASAAEEGR